MRNRFFGISKLFVAGITIVLFSALVALMPPIALADDRNSDIAVSKDNGDVSIFSQENLMCDGKSFLLSELDCLNSCLQREVMCLSACMGSKEPNCNETCAEMRKECKKECEDLNKQERDLIKQLNKKKEVKGS